MPKTNRRAPRAPLPLRLYRLALLLYPRAFRERHGEELWQTCRDLTQEAHASGWLASARFWLAIYADTLAAALGERTRAMRTVSWVARLAAGATLLAVAVSVVASANLYALEDNNPLTVAAYGASPLLRLSYDGAYLAALAAGVMGVTIGLHALLPARIALTTALGLAALVALGGFGGLLIRYPLSGLALIGGFGGLVALGLLTGRAVTQRLAGRMSARASALVGACAGAGIALALDAAALIAHTLALNPISHALYMQGQISGSHYNALLLGMTAQTLTAALCALLLAVALWPGRGAHSDVAAG
jgi:hypothetical protein